MQFAYKTYAKIYKFNCRHNVYKMYPIFSQTFIYNLYIKLRGLWQLQFVYKICTKYWYKYSNPQKFYIIIICIQFVYRTLTKYIKVWGGKEHNCMCTMTCTKNDFRCIVVHFKHNYSSPSFCVRSNFCFVPLTLSKQERRHVD